MEHKELFNKAKEAMQNAYSPYSKFKVGAALVAESGVVYTGCNVENVSYAGAICAERTAFVKAVSSGERRFKAIAVVGSHGDFTLPCGFCRQFMAEFGLELHVMVENGQTVRTYTLNELLPEAFVAF